MADRESSEYDGCAICHEARYKHDDPSTFVGFDDWDPEYEGPLSPHEMDALRARYTSEVVPPCRVCGAELGIGSMGGNGPTIWKCSAVEPMGTKFGSPEWKHYSDSEFRQYRHGDPLVIRLLDQVAAEHVG